MNRIGMRTFYIKNTMRFIRVYNQTLIAPIINSLLFFCIFTVAFGSEHTSDILDYKLLLTSGLVIMSTINGSYSDGVMIVVSKVTGNIIDLITAPLTPAEILLGSCGAAITRALICTVFVYTILSLFQMNFVIHNIAIGIFFIVLSSLICSLIGVICGLLSENFEQASLVTNYVMTPLMFLSGTFYSTTKLPLLMQQIIKINPFFYMIDGFRYGMIGISNSNLIVGGVFLSAIALLLWITAHQILKSGYKIRR